MEAGVSGRNEPGGLWFREHREPMYSVYIRTRLVRVELWGTSIQPAVGVEGSAFFRLFMYVLTNVFLEVLED